jgi:hypothetical protein
MAYTFPFWGFIAGDPTPIVVGYTIDGGQYRGAQWAQAIPQNDPVSLVSTDHTVERAGGRYTYYFWVRNETSIPTFFILTGGGVS